MVEKEILAVFEGKQKGAKSPKRERLCPPKLVCMHFTTTSTCMNSLSQFYFLTPMVKREILVVLKAGKRSHNSKTKKAMPTKIGLHAFHNNLYLHEFFEPILFFDPHGQKGNFGRFEGR